GQVGRDPGQEPGLAAALADNGQPGGDAYASLDRSRGSAPGVGADLVDGLEDLQRGKHGAFGIVLVGHRVAEVHQGAVAEILVYPAAVAVDDARAVVVKCADQALQFFRIEHARQVCRADHVTEHDGQVAALTEAEQRPALSLAERRGGNRFHARHDDLAPAVDAEIRTVGIARPAARALIDVKLLAAGVTEPGRRGVARAARAALSVSGDALPPRCSLYCPTRVALLFRPVRWCSGLCIPVS